MYNRYVRNDNGSYDRIPQEDAKAPNGPQAPPSPPPPPPPPQKQERPEMPPLPHGEAHRQTPPHGEAHRQTPPHGEAHQSPPRGSPPPHPDGLSGFLRHFLDQFHLDHVDTGDLLLLGLLFFLFREDADDELLMALGLLLIL